MIKKVREAKRLHLVNRKVNLNLNHKIHQDHQSLVLDQVQDPVLGLTQTQGLIQDQARVRPLGPMLVI